MHKYRFDKVRVGPVDMTLPVFDNEADAVQDYIVIPNGMFPAAVIELVATYDIEPVTLRDLFDSEEAAKANLAEFFESFKGLTITYDTDSKHYVASCRNGDTGGSDHEYGNSTMEAVANLVRAHGFESKLPHGGEVTLHQWFVDFQYGFERISDELLEAELGAIYTPDKGAW